MLSIGSINNQNHTFKGKINHAQILKEMEELSLKQEEIIVPKIKTQSKAPKKSCFTKINNMIKDFLFDKKFIAPIDTISTQNTYIERYKNGAYKEFDLIPDRLNGDILLKKKEKTPSGIEKIYNYCGESPYVKEKILTDGTKKYYCVDDIYFLDFHIPFTKLHKIILPNGKTIYK